MLNQLIEVNKINFKMLENRFGGRKRMPPPGERNNNPDADVVILNKNAYCKLNWIPIDLFLCRIRQLGRCRRGNIAQSS